MHSISMLRCGRCKAAGGEGKGKSGAASLGVACGKMSLEGQCAAAEPGYRTGRGLEQTEG